MFKSLYEKKNEVVGLSEEYDDYIEYEYWDFVRMTLGYWDGKDLSLYATLSGSVMYRDDGDFILTTPHNSLYDEIVVHLEKIKNNIVRYGKSTVASIRCVCVKMGVLAYAI